MQGPCAVCRLLVEVLLMYGRHYALCLTVLSIVGCSPSLAHRQYTPISYDSQECPCISRCPLKDGTTGENSSCSGINPFVYHFITWLFVFTKLQPQQVLFSPSPPVWVRECDGPSSAEDSWRLPLSRGCFCGTGLCWQLRMLTLEPECVGSYSVLIIF